MTHVVNRLYDTYAEAVAVIGELEAAEISHNDISIVANSVGNDDPTHKNAAAKGAGGTAAGLGAIGAGAGVLAGLGLLAIPGIGPVVAAGWLVSGLAGAAVGAATGAVAGGVAGRLSEHKVSKEDADVYLESIRRGAALVSVRTDEDDREKVEAIMDRHKAVDTAARSRLYRENEWTAFDPSAPAYSAEQIEAERTRYR